MKVNLKPKDIVAPAGQDFPKGEVQQRLPGGNVVVRWPSGLWWKHHNSELRRVV